jgi:hypothetical protein
VDARILELQNVCMFSGFTGEEEPFGMCISTFHTAYTYKRARSMKVIIYIRNQQQKFLYRSRMISMHTLLLVMKRVGHGDSVACAWLHIRFQSIHNTQTNIAVMNSSARMSEKQETA